MADSFCAVVLFAGLPALAAAARRALPGAGVRGCRAIENQHQSRRKQARLGLTQIGQGGDKTRKKVQFCTCVGEVLCFGRSNA